MEFFNRKAQAKPGAPANLGLRAIRLIEVPSVEIIEGVVSTSPSSRTVASSLFVVRRWWRLVVPDPGDGGAGHVAQINGAVVYR
jgi:hypothetical protein